MSLYIWITYFYLYSTTESDHLQLLDQVLDCLEKAGFRARKEKCQFFVPSLTYLGHKIDAAGLHPLFDKVQVIQKAPSLQMYRN